MSPSSSTTLSTSRATSTVAATDEQPSPSPSIITTNASRHSLKRARLLFETLSAHSIIVPPLDKSVHRLTVARRIRNDYPVIPDDDGADLPKEPIGITGHVINEMRRDVIKTIRSGNNDGGSGKNRSSTALVTARTSSDALVALTTDKNTPFQKNPASKTSITLYRETDLDSETLPLTAGQTTTTTTLATTHTKKRILTPSTSSKTRVPTPKWHPPWKLSSVISSHLGWVRSVGFDPTNDMFATGGADRVIKIFDFAKACVGAEDALKITLTGHVSPVRGLAFSERHPYLFSAGEDKMVKCWDLETNQVIRHYHGHLSGVFCLKLHPLLDILVTGGRDAVARVWDMRSKQQIHVLSGHDNTVGAILTKSTDPQIITGSHDTTVKLWDLAAGKCMTTLTHHKKSIRALVQPTFENTFLSGAADTLKKWNGKNGQFIKNFTGHNSVINAMALNDDGVLLSAGDDGTMQFWDYHSGYAFQKTETIPQPGSLDAENGIFAAEFDLTGTRLITCEADKTIKIWKEDEEASELSHPVDLVAWRKKCLTEAKQRV